MTAGEGNIHGSLHVDPFAFLDAQPPLLLEGSDEILKAYLPGTQSMRHPKAILSSIEGLALWLNQVSRVVVSASDLDATSFLGLTDDFGNPQQSLFFTVEVVEKRMHRPSKRIREIGHFTDLRQIRLFSQVVR